MAESTSQLKLPVGPSSRHRRLWACVVIGVVLTGAIFRFAEYIADRSLWLDEAALAQNILHLPLRDLAADRLGERQVAPPGFLLAVRAFVWLASDSEQMLRLVPFAAGLAVLVLVALLAWRRLNPIGAVAVVTLTAWSWPLIYYSNECKQYSTDALCAVLLFALSGKIIGRPLNLRRAMVVGFAGIVALVFSQPALFSLAALEVLGLVEAAKQKNRAELCRWGLLGVIWVSFFSLQMALSFDSTLGNAALFAHHEETFLRLWPWADAQQVWRDNVLGTWIYATSASTWWIWLGLLLLGCWAGWRTHRRETIFIALTILGLAGASLLQVYPLAVRLLLFLFPLLFWLVGQGITWLAESTGGRTIWVAAALLIISAWPMWRDGVQEARQPFAPENLRPVAVKLAALVHPGDEVLVFDLTHFAFDYYWPRLPHADVPVQDVIFEHDVPMPVAEMAAKVAPLLKNNPPRVWLVATHYDLGAAPDNLRTLVAVLRQRYPGAADFAPPSGTAQGVVFFQSGAEPK